MQPQSKGAILLIEDDQRFQENLAVVFRTAGYETLFAANAQDGFRALETYQVDLIVLDYRLPGVDGLQFLTALSSEKKSEEFRGIPVVVITGFPITADEKRRFTELGARALIMKGTGFKELVEIINREVETHRAIVDFERPLNRHFSLPSYLAHIEKQIILRALIKNPSASQEAIAHSLGILPMTLARKLREYKLNLT